MALIGKKKKIVAGHYEYRDYEIKKSGSSWNANLNGETIRTEKTLGKVCEEVDKILGCGSVVKETSEKAPTLSNIFDSSVYNELSSKIVTDINIGNPTSIVPSEMNYSLRWNNFKGDIKEVTNKLDVIMIDFENHSINIHHSKEILFVTISFASSDLSVKNFSKSSEDKVRQSTKELTEISKGCKEVCDSVAKTLLIENARETFNDHSYTHCYHNYKGVKETDLQTVEDIRNDYPNYEIRVYIGLNVCHLTVCRKK